MTNRMRTSRSLKSSILEATRILGTCTTNENRAKGEGDWNLKGLTISLFHHQVLGAAKMKSSVNSNQVLINL